MRLVQTGQFQGRLGHDLCLRETRQAQQRLGLAEPGGGRPTSTTLPSRNPSAALTGLPPGRDRQITPPLDGQEDGESWN
jgi:hypothetical protein